MNQMISVASGFQYSVNIGYDLNNDDKLRNFIPTRSALELLEDILSSTAPSSANRARVLIGAYGKGKSHIVLTILAMLLKKDLSLFEKLMPKVQENPRLLQLVQNYYESNNKILPVVITGSSTSLTQAFTLSLQHTLSEFGLLDSMPETNYKAAASVISRWESEFPETYQKFAEQIDEPVSVFVEKLANYDVTAYETFERIYPTLTAGSVFNPFLGFDVVELYESVAKSLKPKGYTGIYVVYDEFSKFLEANIVSASVSDTKMLQDFAEKCARSGELQLHLMLISHKEISNYIDKLPQQKVDGWRGVSERFRHIHMNNNFSQTYEIIASVIQHHEPAWSQFVSSRMHDFDTLKARYGKHQMFTDAAQELDTAIYGCYPLHPVSTFILPRLSERVAQNERTLFTFLSAEGTETLPSFLEKTEDEQFNLITPDLIYDYFEPLFQKEAYAGDIHSTYVLTSVILNQIEGLDLERKIVKTISLIYILEQFERLKPTKEEIIGIFSSSYTAEEIEAAITDLIEKEFVIYIRQSNGYLRLKKTSGVDVRQKIRDTMEAQAGRVSIKDILNNSNFDSYMYPSRYNDEREMTRYFTFQFISSSEVAEDVNWQSKAAGVYADGVIYGVIPGNVDELSRVSEVLSKTTSGLDRFIFAVPKRFQEIGAVVAEYAAVSDLKDRAVDDPILFDEYEVIFEDLQEIIKDFIGGFTHPETYRCVYIHDGQKLTINRKSQLTELMSKICDLVYSLTPVVNNEMVNKTDITSIAATSRNKIVAALLRGELEPGLGLAGNGQEVSIMRSTLIRTGIWSEETGVATLNLHPSDPRMENLLTTIEAFVLEAREQGRKSFSELYERLTSPEHHIGLRLGLIPIYVAVVLHEYRQQTVINDRFSAIPTSADVLVQINAEPNAFSLEYLDWNPEKENYISRLSAAFHDYTVEAEKAGSSYDYVSNAMHRWYMALPKYSKECKLRPDGGKIRKRYQEMMKLLRQNTSGSDLLFKKLPEAFAYDECTSDVAEEIIAAKDLFDSLLSELKKYLIEGTKTSFLPEEDKASGANQTLTATVKEWCESLDPKSFEQLFQDGTDRFLQHLKTITNDEDSFITRLAKLATGLRIEDWDANTSEKYFSAIESYKKTAKEFHSSVVAETINATSSYQIVFADEEGQSTTRRFDKIEVSARGKLLFNQITASLDAMGHSISEQEKRQILMEVLKKLC
ncbi:MAG: restriction endonuclease subunit S [Clostridia bacterium]|nr:restriction endonuclease subunit S [Clostridia bacterium]